MAGVGLESSSRPLTNPGRRLSAKELDTEQLAVDGPAATSSRARLRPNILASDHPDVAFGENELCRSVASPTQRDAEAL